MHGTAGAGARGAAPGMRRRLSWLLLGALAGGAPLPAQEPPAPWSGTVTRVIDGDTLWLRPRQPGTGTGEGPVKLRLAGIDAPERCQDGGRQAREALAGQVLHRAVRVEPLGIDDHGRVLGRVRLEAQPGDGTLEEVDVGAWLVAQGLAWSWRPRGGPGPYEAQERAARAAGRGLFADPGARPPWRFRREHGPCE